MKEMAAVYTVSPNYIPQAFLSALQLKSHSARPVRIFIICFGSIGSNISPIEDYFRASGIELIQCAISMLQGLPIACARFFISKILPDDFDSVVYLDADTQIFGSIFELQAAPFGNKSIMAAPDPMSLISEHNSKIGKASLAHFNKLNLHYSKHEAYINSGVMRLNMSHWDAISRECVSMISDRKDLFYFDQDAINIVAKNDLILLSLKWNFPAFLLNSNIKVLPAPCIVHFMSNPRPWHGSFMPWGKEYYFNYKTLFKNFPQLESLTEGISILRIIMYKILMLEKFIFESAIWKSNAVKMQLITYEKIANLQSSPSKFI